MSQLIERFRGRLGDFLDVGTGTGILSIIALKCNANKVLGIDIEGDALKTAKENFVNNKCADYQLKKIDLAAMKISKKYDFVAANLISHDLIKYSSRIISLVKPGKFFAVSGISLDNFSLVKDSFKRFSVRCLKILKGKEWAALLYQKNEKG